ncbi:MAG: outer membrane protein transport protein [Myxococcales bacterium]|nr:outer membrane protein transport protein [Myxococcales bacterium]
MRRTIPILASLLSLSANTGVAHASSALEYPDNGVAQFSRAGAWLATATDPIAGFYNPAGLATQATSFGIGLNLAFQTICFDRKGPGGTEIGPSKGLADQGFTYGEVCNSNAGQPNAIPNLAFTWRAAEKLGVGLTIVPPSSYGTLEWPYLVSVEGRDQPLPAPQRFLSLYTKGTILFPTLSVGYSVTDRFHVGVGFVAGIALLEFRSMSMSNVDQTNPGDQYTQDTRSRIKVKDLFVPGVVVGSLFEATDNLDLAGWYRYSDKIRAEGDLEVIAPFFNSAGTRRRVCAYSGETKDDPGKGCADITRSEDQVGKNGAKVVLGLPMEARVGARWHMPRKVTSPLEAESFRKDRYRVRDPLRDDLYDMELDLTWANNSSVENVEIRFADGINVLGLPGTVPTNADRPTGWRDSFGARLGMQYNAMRNLMGLRLGTWVESSAAKAEYLTVTGVPALRGGFGGGFVLRAGSVDIESGYQHIWNAGLDNGGDGQQRAIAGSGSADHRSYHAVNGGKVSQHANVFSLGAVARF